MGLLAALEPLLPLAFESSLLVFWELGVHCLVIIFVVLIICY